MGLSLKMKTEGEYQWWIAKEHSTCSQSLGGPCSSFSFYDNIYLMTFSQRVAPSTVSLITGSG